MLINCDHNGAPIARVRGETDEVEWLDNVQSLRVGRGKQVLSYVEGSLLTEHMVGDASHHWLFYV